jgi:hypothetical protein
MKMVILVIMSIVSAAVVAGTIVANDEMAYAYQHDHPEGKGFVSRPPMNQILSPDIDKE